MATIYPKALKAGDEVRVIAPATSCAFISADTRKIAQDRLQNELGLKLTFGKNIEEKNKYGSSSIKSRVEDLHAAFADKNVKAIITVLGGFNSEEILSSIDWSLIKRNPKILCGYSDITALSNSIYARTGLVAFSGPHYSSFGMKRGFDYSLEQFKKAIMGTHRYQVLPSANWSDDAWYMEQEKREFIENPGYKALKAGKARGTIVGGNLSTLALLFGTPNMPRLDGSILFVEDCLDAGKNSWVVFMRQFGSLVAQKDFSKIKGLVIGRFQKEEKVTAEDLSALISNRPELSKLNIPVVYGADFGHTTPFFTFGIGGTAEIHANERGASLTFEPFVKE